MELHGPVGGGEQLATNPNFHMSDGRGDADRVAWRHDQFNGSEDLAIPFAGGFWLMPIDLELFADRNGTPRRLYQEGWSDQLGPWESRKRSPMLNQAATCPFVGFWPRVGKVAGFLHAGRRIARSTFTRSPPCLPRFGSRSQ